MQDGNWTVLYKEGVEAYVPQTEASHTEAAGGDSEMDIEAELAAMSKNQRGEGWLGEVSPINAMLDKYYAQLSAKEKFTQVRDLVVDPHIRVRYSVSLFGLLFLQTGS